VLERHLPEEVRSGLFVYDYDGPADFASDLLVALNRADAAEDHPITCVAWGPNLFVKYWSTGGPGQMWVSHRCDGLAAGCFIMDMIAILTRNPGVSDFRVLNEPVLDGKISPNFQVKRGVENKVEPLAGR
jgi:hypothetical protein